VGPDLGTGERVAVKISLWRAFALAGSLMAITMVVGDLAIPKHPAGYGLVTSAGLHSSVTRVTPGSPAARAGIVPGDRVDLVPGAANLAASLAPEAGSKLALDVAHGGIVRRVTLVATPIRQSQKLPVFLLPYELLRIVMVAVALLIVLRRAERADARALATFSIAFAFSAPATLITGYSPALIVTLRFVQQFAVLFALQQALAFATIFPSPSAQGLRALLRRATPLVFGAVIVLSVLGPAGMFLADSVIAQFANVGFAVLMILAMAIAFMLAFRDAAASDRPRLQWIAYSLVVGFCGFIVAVLFLKASWSYLPGLTIFAIPIGVAYAVFRHRMFDVSFVVSRTLTFAVLSAIVVLAFSGLEWLIGTVLVNVGHLQGIVMNAALALVIGFSMDRMRTRVDRAVDNLFFRERRHAEECLRRFSAECGYISSEAALVQRTLDALHRYARVESALYLIDKTGAYDLSDATLPAAERVDGDDPAVVAMRARRGPVEIDDPDAPSSALPGVVVFPMLLGGRLSGAICCGPRSSGEAFDPDERHVLAALANSVAAAFAAIEIAALKASPGRIAVDVEPNAVDRTGPHAFT
jgi:hypothetical protein